MTMARILSACPPTVCGPVRLVIFDIHTLQNRFYFGDSVIPCLLTALPLLMRCVLHGCPLFRGGIAVDNTQHN